MTLEELKKEADSLGYRLVKKQVQPELLLRCTCGCRRRVHWSRYANGKWSIILKCQKCGREAAGPTLAEARRDWNKMVSDGADA